MKTETLSYFIIFLQPNSLIIFLNIVYIMIEYVKIIPVLVLKRVV